MDRIMVCVTRQITCLRLIDLGARLAKSRRGELTVVHALRPSDSVLGSTNEAEALEYLFRAAVQAGGGMSVIRADDVAGALVNEANKTGATLIVLGASPKTEPISFSQRLRNQLPNTEIITVEADSFENGVKVSMNADRVLNSRTQA